MAQDVIDHLYRLGSTDIRPPGYEYMNWRDLGVEIPASNKGYGIKKGNTYYDIGQFRRMTHEDHMDVYIFKNRNNVYTRITDINFRMLILLDYEFYQYDSPRSRSRSRSRSSPRLEGGRLRTRRHHKRRRTHRHRHHRKSYNHSIVV